MIALSSSTWVTVHSLHGFAVPFMWSDCTCTAALSKNLKTQNGVRLDVLCELYDVRVRIDSATSSR